MKIIKHAVKCKRKKSLREVQKRKTTKFQTGKKKVTEINFLELQ